MLNTFMNLLLYWFSGYLRCRIIRVHGQPYLERYYLGSLFGRHVYLHRFLESDDPTQGVHDHPWAWSISLIVCGFYVEVRRWGCKVRRWFNVLGGDTFHRVMLVPSVYTWSVFVTGRRKPGSEWGFFGPWQGERDTWQWHAYEYSVGDNNPYPGEWWLVEPRGKQAAREPRDYVKVQQFQRELEHA